MAKNKIITSQGNVQFINSKGKTINMHPMHCYAVYEDDTVSFLFIYMKEYSGQAFFASQFEDLEVNGETYDNMDDLKDAINYAFAKAGAQARTEIVEELPEDPFTNTIYLLPKEHGEGYDEYIWNEDEGWQLIGDTDIEFERYLKIDDFNPYSAATKDYIDAVSGETVANHNDIVALSGAIDTEISARTDADAFISGAVDTVSADLVSESQRAISAETQLQNNINTVNSRVDAEQIARAQADNALSGAIDSVSGAVDTEVSARTAADEALDNKIDTVSGDVIAETSRAEGAEIALGGRIDNEITARTAADNALQNNINNEASARTAADEALSGAVDTVSSGLTEEAQRAQDAESAIDLKVDTLSGEVQTMGEEAVVDAAYISSATTIEFYNASGTVVASIDATDFIKDGMIEDVRIENGYLIIDFNTASGIEDIQIPLTDIFDPDNYYDKTAIDNIVSGLNDSIDTKLAISDFNTYSGAVDSAIASKFDASAITAYSTTVEVGNAIEAATSGKVDTTAFTAYSASVETALSGKADLSALTEDERVWGEALNDLNSRINTVSGDVVGKQDALVAGRGVDITSDVISLDFPISAGTGVDSLLMSGSGNTASGNYSVAFGKLNTVSGECGVIMGNRNTSNNFAETAFGQKNVSRTEAASSFGSSGNTIFTVGNGIINVEQGVDANHNAFEIRGNGDIYISDTNAAGSYYEKPMIKLQDHLGGGGSSYTAGDGIDITNDVISVTGKVDTSDFDTYSASVETAINDLNEYKASYTYVEAELQTKTDNITFEGFVSDFNTYSGTVETRLTEDEEVTASGLNALNDKFGGLKLMKITQAAYDALTVKDNNTLYIISD